MIRVLIVEDSVFMRTLVTDILRNDPEIEVVGDAPNGIVALERIRELEPDAITLDIEMPRMNGLEVLAALQGMEKKPKVLMLSSLTEKGAYLTRKAMESGADDFLLKPRDIVQAKDIGMDLVAKIKSLFFIPPSARSEDGEGEEAERIVLVGSSAGGPPMLDRLLSSMNGRVDAAVVITQHMPPGFTAPLSERLNRISVLPVKETVNGEPLIDGRVYVSKAGYHTMIVGDVNETGKAIGRVVHSRSPPLHAVRPAVDVTFSTAARVFKSDSLAVILSGMGNDGGEGAFMVKKAGGQVIVCREQDCLVYGMARSALERGCVDRVVPLDAIARNIMEFSSAAGVPHAG
ncbi:MAG: chemotaxis-specific protein-glutamate methyltransferase CheB [Methanomicrobiales archaeon]|nr:chemotaxis-specific protein-glutamate methyltransferase CheB [Methanomicrobiales archaeon]